MVTYCFNFLCSIYYTFMDHTLQGKDLLPHGIPKEWKSRTIKQGLPFLDVQEKVVDLEEAIH